MPAGAPARILPMYQDNELHLSLVDNVGIGDDIVSEAQKRQRSRLEAVEDGAQVAPVRRTRRRRTAAQKPEEAPVEVSNPLHPGTKALAKFLAGNDWTRCEVVRSPDAAGGLAVVVHNNPIRKARKKRAGRTRGAS